MRHRVFKDNFDFLWLFDCLSNFRLYPHIQFSDTYSKGGILSVR